MSIFKRKEMLLLLRLAVGITFLYASMDKVLRPDQFAISVRAYHILPVIVTNLFAVVLAWAEFCSGLLLILGVFTRQAAGALLLLLMIFICALTTVIARGMVIDCGCFTSDGGASVNFLLILRNILLATACFLIMRYDRGWMSLGSRYQPATD